MPKHDRYSKLLGKREAVVPFQGEENFIVPKKGGFGQPDMEGYVMVTGTLGTRQTTLTAPELTATKTETDRDVIKKLPTQIAGLPIDMGGGTIKPTSSTTLSAPIRTTVLTGQTGYESGEMLPTTKPQAPVKTITAIDPSLPSYQTGTLGETGVDIPIKLDSPTTSSGLPLLETDIPLDLPIKPIGGGTITPPPPPPPADTTISTYPTYPNWSSLSCAELQTKIAYFEGYLANNKFTADVAASITNQIATAKGLYALKCPIKTEEVPVIVPPIGAAPIAGGGGGGVFGGGGGGAAVGEDEAALETMTEEDKSKQGGNLLLWAAIIGVTYFVFFRK